MVDSPTPNTAALVPSSSNIKRLSTIGKGSNDQPVNGSPVKSRSTAAPGASANAAKDVVSPAELCGFVSGGAVTQCRVTTHGDMGSCAGRYVAEPA